MTPGNKFERWYAPEKPAPSYPVRPVSDAVAREQAQRLAEDERDMGEAR